MSQVPISTDGNALRVWFAQIYGKIDELHAAVFAQSGFMLFKTHNYTAEELLGHPLLESIHALCGQIDNVVQSWQANGAADADTVKLYYDNRILTEQRLSSLRAEIVARKPTAWEALLQTFEHLMSKALKLLPLLPAMLLERYCIPVGAIQRHLSARSNELDDIIDAVVVRR
jgi:hypothetical protein